MLGDSCPSPLEMVSSVWAGNPVQLPGFPHVTDLQLLHTGSEPGSPPLVLLASLPLRQACSH